MRRLACCRREKEISLDFDEQEPNNGKILAEAIPGIVTYNGLESIESCILNSSSYDNDSSTSRGIPTDSMDEDAWSSSSSKDTFGSFPKWLMNKQEEHGSDEWEYYDSSERVYAKNRPTYSNQYLDVESMKERFSKLLLGEDISGGCRGISTALALSNAITKLAVSVFGEMWKLEPLTEERKNKWRIEMDWLLSPTNYMVELVPAKQNGANGRTLEIMTPKARSDIHMNLPALRKLDSMLIETLDSMVKTEFWYAEGGSRAEGRRQGMKWWLPSPRVPTCGLSTSERKKLGYRGKYVHQVLKAAKSINQNVLLEMPIPAVIRDALPKSGKTNLGEDLYKALCTESCSVDEIFGSLKFKTEHDTLEIANRLEAAVFAWRQRITDQVSGKSPSRHSWHFVRSPELEMDKIERLVNKAETLLQLLKVRFPNLPQTFIDVTKVQFNKDVGYSVTEAYSRVLGCLAFSILSRISDILQEDDLNKPDSPVSKFKSDCYSNIYLPGVFEAPVHRIRHSLIDQMNMVDGRVYNSSIIISKAYDEEFSDHDRSSTASTTPSTNRTWCYNREVCSSTSPSYSP